MEKLIVSGYEELANWLGKEIGPSDYMLVTQEHINKFADATLDWQWIHTDPQRAAKDSPYKKTIAHGYFSISILPYFWMQLIDVRNLKMMINYAIEKVRFGDPVLVDSEIRIRVKLHSINKIRGITKAKINVTLEIKGNSKPAMQGFVTFLYHFDE